VPAEDNGACFARIIERSAHPETVAHNTALMTKVHDTPWSDPDTGSFTER
jgi:hypothetical protein